MIGRHEVGDSRLGMDHDWRQITGQHGPLVWKVIFRILRSRSETLDCYQDVMLEAFKQSTGKSIDNWSGYLRWLAVRRGLDRLRSRKRNPTITHADIDLFEDRNHDSNTMTGCPDSLALEELKERLRIELSKLPAKQAEAFWMKYVEQLSYAEIAKHMGIESSAVGVLIHRARPRVQKSLSDLQPNT